MSSERIQKMTQTFTTTLIDLYLDNPGVGEFYWEKIYDNLPRNRMSQGGMILYTKNSIEGNIAEIIREAHEQGVFIVRKGKYYKIQNIKDVIVAYQKTQRMAPRPFPQPAIFRELWGGSGVVGEKIGK